MSVLPTESEPVKVVVGDCIEALRALPEGCASLVFADPPFNIGYQYDTYEDELPRAQYLAWARDWTRECVRRLTPTGAFFLSIGYQYAADYKLMLDAHGLTMRNWLIWHYAFGPHMEKRFGMDHAHVLYYARDPKRFVFNSHDIRVESERQRSGDKRANPLGRVPGDVWSIPRLPGNAKERTGHPCQLPEAVLERVIRAASNPGDLVIDPFCGSGTTAAVAKRLGRRCLTCELSEAYAARAVERIGGAA